MQQIALGLGHTEAYSDPCQLSRIGSFEKNIYFNYFRKKVHLRYLTEINLSMGLYIIHCSEYSKILNMQLL